MNLIRVKITRKKDKNHYKIYHHKHIDPKLGIEESAPVLKLPQGEEKEGDLPNPIIRISK